MGNAKAPDAVGVEHVDGPFGIFPVEGKHDFVIFEVECGFVGDLFDEVCSLGNSGGEFIVDFFGGGHSVGAENEDVEGVSRVFGVSVGEFYDVGLGEVEFVGVERFEVEVEDAFIEVGWLLEEVIIPEHDDDGPSHLIEVGLAMKRPSDAERQEKDGSG